MLYVIIFIRVVVVSTAVVAVVILRSDILDSAQDPGAAEAPVGAAQGGPQVVYPRRTRAMRTRTHTSARAVRRASTAVVPIFPVGDDLLIFYFCCSIYRCFGFVSVFAGP